MASQTSLRVLKVTAGASVSTALFLLSPFESAVLTGEDRGERRCENVGSTRLHSKVAAGADTSDQSIIHAVISREMTSPFHILKTECEVPSAEEGTSSEEDEDDFPNLTRHGSALLRKHLTPEVFKRLRHLKTSSGVTLEDMIRAGVTLPLGRHPPRGVGLYAGDAECYKIFAPLLYPIIDDYHKTNLSFEEKKRFNPRLQRHTTNLNPEFVLSQRPDPTGEYILYTRARASRSIEGFNYGPSLSRSDRRKVENLVKSCVDDWKDDPLLGRGKYKSLWDMTNSEHDDLIQRHILFFDPDEWAIEAGFGRDWPDGRGLFCSVHDYTQTPEMMIWCNAEDHIRIVSMSKGGDIKDVFATVSKAVQQVDRSLQRRGHFFAYDDNLGFLNSCPTNLGTGLRVHVFVKLVRLGRDPGFRDLVKRLRLQAYGAHGVSDQRYTGIFDICNTERLGKNEVELINIIIQGVGKLIDLEKRLERGESVDCSKE